MPIYVYRCRACEHAHEVLQKFSDPPLTVCPTCGGALQKQFSPEVGLSFKGSGFYITDYVRNQNGSKPAAETATKSESSASQAKKMEA
ncbi:MAG: hypothetical protein ONB48_00700 [candidate division KSB1 bacterium]|nr:hypothetical protein [candidate division KSB1 bacterium]MDZ7272803.1 hypothetical protein [candidate division KSB1 bacterium]MDZ7284173.1 hypothetical protein [candidate division KSB1 bacterium]MDZ7297429.1 hypothetical protein [candidate division KSB1 bacterium]MDZ7308177.1 hypothetical protein [candidate division KSB1 bacterium]